MNPWCMDDDVYANEGYYTKLKRTTRPSFDSKEHSIIPVMTFPL